MSVQRRQLFIFCLRCFCRRSHSKFTSQPSRQAESPGCPVADWSGVNAYPLEPPDRKWGGLSLGMPQG